MNTLVSSPGETTALIKIIKFLVLLLMATLCGYAASKGQPVYLALILPLLAGLAIATSYQVLLVLTLFGGLVVAGVTQLYLPQLQLIRWAFGASASLLLLHIAIEALRNHSRPFVVDSAVIFWSLIYILILVGSAVGQGLDIGIAMISLKGYLQVWGVLFALAFLPWKPAEMDRLPVFLLLIALIQFPFALHQYFVLVPLRALITDVPGMVPIDIVSGTFGGKADHGGANAALTVLCFIVASGLLALWKNGQLATRHCLPLIILVMLPTFFNSTKISILYLLIVLLLTYSDEFITSPLKFLSRLAVTLCLCAFVAYSAIMTMPENSDISSISDLFQQTYSYNVAEDTIRDDRLSRSGAVRAWLNPTNPHAYKNLIVGYGLGSSRLLDSEGGRHISETINLEKTTGITALAAILWETGILGFLSVLMLFISAFHAASKLKRTYYNNLYRRSLFSALRCAVVILFISLFHKSFFIYHIGFQTLFVALFGYLAYWERRGNTLPLEHD